MRPIVPLLQPVYAALAEPAYGLLRFIAGAFLVPQGMWKLFGSGGDQAQMVQFFAGIGLRPAMLLVIAVGLVEFLGGILVALGLLTAPGSFRCGRDHRHCRALFPSAERLLRRQWRHGVRLALGGRASLHCGSRRRCDLPRPALRPRDLTDETLLFAARERMRSFPAVASSRSCLLLPMARVLL